MKSQAKLGGWWRLWIVCSVLWLSMVGGASYMCFPSNEMAAHSIEFVNSMPKHFRDRLSLDSTSALTTGAEFPNGYVMSFRQGTSDADMNEVAREYARLAEKTRLEERREYLINASLLAVVPIILAAVFGTSIAWVRRGFQGSSDA